MSSVKGQAVLISGRGALIAAVHSAIPIIRFESLERRQMLSGAVAAASISSPLKSSTDQNDIAHSLLPSPQKYFAPLAGAQTNGDYKPSQVAAPATCGVTSLVGSSSDASGPAASPRSPETGVRHSDGSVQITLSSFDAGGFGQGLANMLSWKNRPDGEIGFASEVGWQNTQTPTLYQFQGFTDSSEISHQTLAFTDGAGGQYWFDATDSTHFTPRFYGAESLVAESNSTAADSEYVLTDAHGNVTRFYSFDEAIASKLQGKLKSSTGADGVVVTPSYDPGGRLTQLVRTESGTTESMYYEYGTISASGMTKTVLQAVTLRRKTGGGTWSPSDTIRKAEYAYYDGSDDNGNFGNLKLQTVKDSSGTAIDHSYVRYYKSGDTNGFAGAIKTVFRGTSYDRLADYATAHSQSIDSVTDANANTFADVRLEYDSEHRVTTAVVQGSGCSACTNGLGTYTYAYSTNPHSDPDIHSIDFNIWRTKTVESLPDGSQRIVYTNEAGQVMLSVEKSGSDEWSTAYKYDDSGRVTMQANPSAVIDRSESSDDLLHYVSNDGDGTPGYEFLSNSSGLINYTNYYTTTSSGINATTAGGVAGYVSGHSISRGENTSPITLDSKNYFKETLGSSSIFLTASVTSYAQTDGTGARTTQFAYELWGSETTGTTTDDLLAVRQTTVTNPTITTAENGSNSSTSSVEVYDKFGNVIWTKDAAGYVNYFTYDLATGAVLSQTLDANPTAISGAPVDAPSRGSGLPTALALTTSYEVDSQGRVTKVTDPKGNITYTVYKDANHEVRTYPGWDPTYHTVSGPIIVQREDRGRHYSEILTMSPDPDFTGSSNNYIPTGAETISHLESLSRSIVNDAGQVIYSDVYVASGLTYSTDQTIGISGVHYSRTEYGYDWRGRQARVKSPNGTWTHTVFDNLGRVSTVWVGTNNTGWTQLDPSNNGAADDNMVKVSENTYDQGGVGDSNLTKTLSIPDHSDSSQNRRMDYLYDWRNRMIISKSAAGAEGTSDFSSRISRVTMNNLGEVQFRFAMEGAPIQLSDITYVDGVPTLPSGAAYFIRGREKFDYDSMGRTFKRSVYSVNSSGASDPTTLVTNTWFDARGQVIKTASTAGAVSKSVYDGAGRVTAAYTTDGGGDTSYDDADDVTGDVVLEQSEYQYDNNGNVILAISKQRFHDAADSLTGALGDPSSTGSTAKARRSYVASYYDNLDRLTASVNVGTNGGSAFTRPTTAPTQSAGDPNTLVTSYAYDTAGRLFSTVDPKGIESRTLYDLAGRTTKTIENHTIANSPGNDHDRTTVYTYDPSGHVLAIGNIDPDPFKNVMTHYLYGVSAEEGSKIDSNDILSGTIQNTALVIGTTGDDLFWVWQSGSDVVVQYGDVTNTYSTNSITSLAFDGGNGNDSLVIASTLTLPNGVFFYNGKGSDTLEVSNTGTSFTFDGSAGASGRNLTLKVSNGAQVTFNSSQRLHKLDIGAGSTVAVASNHPGEAVGGDKLLILDELAIGGSGLSMGKLDLTNNDLIIRSTSSSAATGKFDLVKSWVTTGADSATAGVPSWTGRGITSSNAAADPSLSAIGTILNDTSNPYVSSLSAIDGIALKYTDVLLKFTPAADIDLNGTLDDHDVAILGLTYDPTSSGSKWVDGDITYDGLVDDIDVALIGLSYSVSAVINLESPIQTSKYDNQTVNALGEVIQSTDRNGNVHKYTYDVLGRLTSDAVTVLGSGVDGSVRLKTTGYNTQGLPEIFTTYDAANGGNVVNQIQREYNGLGQLTREYQAVDGQVDTDTTPFVQYDYSAISSGSRLASMTYPNGRIISYNYGSSGSLNDRITRLTSLSDSFVGGTVESYDYLGMNTVVQRSNPSTGVSLTYIGSTAGDGGDQYTGFDRFGRVLNQLWKKSGTTIDSYSYTYDRDSNRLTKFNLTVGNTSLDEEYTYDNFNRLISMKRGDSTYQSWGLDNLGNASTVTTSGSTETRAHNVNNQIISVNSTPLTYDAVGNMLTDNNGKTFVYDAWYHLIKQKTGTTTNIVYAYDALDRRVKEGDAEIYFNGQLQEIEERNSGGSVTQQLVQSPVYVNAYISRDRDADNNGTLDEHLGFTQDANFNVTGVTNSSGGIVTYFSYDSYGQRTVYNTSWSSTTDSRNIQQAFQGGKQDAITHLLHFGIRDLHVMLQIWIQPDIRGGFVDGMNLYQYVQSNPAVLADATGRQSTTQPTTQPTSKKASEPDIQLRNVEVFFDIKSVDSCPWVSTTIPRPADGSVIFGDTRIFAKPAVVIAVPCLTDPKKFKPYVRIDIKIRLFIDEAAINEFEPGMLEKVYAHEQQHLMAQMDLARARAEMIQEEIDKRCCANLAAQAILDGREAVLKSLDLTEFLDEANSKHDHDLSPMVPPKWSVDRDNPNRKPIGTMPKKPTNDTPYPRKSSY